MSEQDLKTRVTEILQAEIAPALQIEDIGLEVVDVRDGVVQIRFGEACASCPSTVMTLITGIEQELREKIPEIDYLEAVP